MNGGPITQQDVALFGTIVLLVFFTLVVVCFLSWWLSNRAPSLSPYTKLPLRFARDLSYDSKEKVLRYLYELRSYDNWLFDFNKAAFCRDTGRLFPNALDFFGVVRLDWTFLQKRFPGSYVSWGSLTKEQQEAIRLVHTTLEGFQTNISSQEPSPRLIEPEIAELKPGPLYVDVSSNTLLGWKIVPGTELEVLIVQKPKPPFQTP